MKHGTRTGYGYHRCRCDDCCEANRKYNLIRDRKARAVAYGIAIPEPSTFVDATEVRAHLIWLSERGIGRRTISDLTGVSMASILAIKTGKRQKCLRRSAELIMAVNLSQRPSNAHIDATRSLNQVADLVARGWTKRKIAQILTGNEGALSLQLKARITVHHAEVIDQLWRQVMAPEHAERELVAYRKREWRAKQRTSR